MIDDAFQTGTDAALLDLAQRPLPKPVPQQRFSAWRATTAAPRGGVSAAAEVLGSLSDVLQAFGTVGAITAASDPVMLATANRKMLEDERARAKETIASGNLFTSEVGDSFRSASEYWQPDPVTAHAAENLVFDFTRVGGKVIGGALAAGPIGIGLASAEEGFTQSDRLRQQGVDLATRTKVGGINAAATGLGAALPVAGGTLAKTAGLVAIGGPGTFIAQQAATREILNSAGYSDLASTYDPFDPVGLTVSTLIPAAFGAHGLRASRARAAAEVRTTEPTPVAEPAAVAQEPQMTATAAAARSLVDRETVDAARVAYAIEQRRSGALADPGDLRGMAMDDAAVARALDQMARGERVEVTASTPEAAPRQVLVRMNETLTRLEETRAELVAQAEGLAERGQIREAQAQLSDIERQKPDTSPAAIEEVAREIQARSDRKLLKTAIKEARQLVDDRLLDWQGRVDRLNEIINRNAVAQKAVQDLPAVDRQLQDARAAAEADAANAEPAAAAARAMERLAAGDIQAAARIAQEAMNRPPGQLDMQAARPAARAAGGGDAGAPASPEAARLAELETYSPQALDAEIVTGWDDKGQATERMTARQYLDEVQRVAQEEAADAQLLQVAAQCALRG